MSDDQQRLERALGERVKELTLLHAVGALLGDDRVGTDVLLARVAALLPPAMQYPEACEARVSHGALTHATPGFRPDAPLLSAGFETSDGVVGRVEVVCVEDRPAADLGPFLDEERALVDSVASMLRAHLDRRAVLDTLRAAQTRYSDLVNTVDGIVWETDATTLRFRFVSHQAERILGFPLSRWHDEPGFWEGRIHPEDRDHAVRYCLEQTARGEDHAFEYRMLRADGRVAWIRDVVTYVSTPEGPLLRGIMLDVTEQREADRRVRESAETLHATLESLTDAFFTLDRAWRFTFLNGEAERLLDRRREDLIGRDVWVEFPEGRGAPFETEYNRAFAEGVTVSFEAYFPPMDRWFAVRAYPSSEGLAVYFRDVTARHQAEEALRASEERFRELADNVGDIFYNYDPVHDRLLYANRSYEGIFGRSLDDVYRDPTSYLDHIHPEDRPQAEAAFDRQKQGHETWVTFRVVRPDGSVRWVQEHAVPVEDAAGRVERIVGTMRDVTEHKEIEAQLLRTQRIESIGTLAGGIAHDLNNVLAPILLAIDGLRGVVTDDDARGLLEILEGSARRGADLVRQVLLFARGAEGERVPQDPRAVVHEVRRILEEIFPKRLRLRFDVRDDAWWVVADSTQLHQVLMNLCVNARDATPGEGTLSIAVRNVRVGEALGLPGVVGTPRPGPHVLIEVADTGTGIPPEIREKIFDPFFSTKSVGEGTGLGLPTSLSIVRSHGGFLQVDSTPGRGTTFRVYLPATTEAAQGPFAPDQDEDPHRGRGELVLVVDDEDAIRQVARRLLQARGYRVLLARDGEEALAAHAAHAGDVAAVLTDLSMPGMDGPTLIAALRARSPDLPILASSGVSAGDLAERARKVGARHFVAKPYTATTLLRALRQALDDSRHRP